MCDILLPLDALQPLILRMQIVIDLLDLIELSLDVHNILPQLFKIHPF